jgi:magnesium-transporting ATPase (P-type)
VLFAASVDLFALTPVFSRRIDTTGLSGGILFAWAFFGSISLVLLIFLWFGMWWHWLVIGRYHASARNIWFAILVCALWWGSAIYYLLVYLPSTFPPHLTGDLNSTNSTSGRTITERECQGLRWQVFRFRGPKSDTA